jgi:hypothetical protein
MRLLALGTLTIVAACAQAVVDTPQKIEDARKLLDSVRGRASGCDVVPIGPRFNFTLLPNTPPPARTGNRSGVRPNNGPDIIQFVVEQLGGKVLRVDSPGSFANAVGK